MMRTAILILPLAVSACQQPPAEAVALSESIRRLNDFEDRAIALVRSDDRTGLLLPSDPPQALLVIEEEARRAVLVGCADEARKALVASLEEINRGGGNSWPLVERYNDTAEACEETLSKMASS